MFAIASADLDWGIGKDGGLLKHISADMKFFRERTMGGAVIMGRKTFDSLPGRKPLPGRENAVITRDTAFSAEGVVVLPSVESAAELYGGRDDAAVIGGGSVYAAMLPYISRAYITRFYERFGADTFFPDLDVLGWKSVSLGGGEDGGLKYGFFLYERLQIDIEITNI